MQNKPFLEETCTVVHIFATQCIFLALKNMPDIIWQNQIFYLHSAARKLISKYLLRICAKTRKQSAMSCVPCCIGAGRSCVNFRALRYFAAFMGMNAFPRHYV